MKLEIVLAALLTFFITSVTDFSLIISGIIFIIFVILIIAKSKIKPRVSVPLKEEWDFDLDALLDVCMNFSLPNNSILKRNEIKVSTKVQMESVAKQIVEFYSKRNITIEYSDGEAGINIDLLKFRDIVKNKDQAVSTNDITKHKIDLARSLKLSETDITYLSTIYGEDTFGIYVPAKASNVVRLSNIFEDNKFREFVNKFQLIKGDECLLNALPVVLGANTNGFVYFNLVDSPHILVAGSTGSGKSVCINTILSSLLMLHSPESLQLYLADLKDGIELFDYQGLPHVKGFYDDTDSVVDMLQELEIILSQRNRTIRNAKCKSITQYNENIRNADKFLPYILVVVDEFITISDDADAIDSLVQLSAKARASGIFFILSTQKPTKNVIDTRIKANMNSRICFKTADETESRVVLDVGEAASLRGSGDGLLKTEFLERFQGCFVDAKESTRIIKHWKPS